jgi:hypothetical protein
VFGAEHVEEPKADLKELHAKIGQQALEIDFLPGALGKGKLCSHWPLRSSALGSWIGRVCHS